MLTTALISVLLAWPSGPVIGAQVHGKVGGPSCSQASVDQTFSHSGLSTPVSLAPRHAIYRDQVGIALVPVLLGLGRPAAVVGLVVPVVVDPLDAVLTAWPTPHVGDEVPVSVLAEPTLADGDSSTTVARMGMVSRVEATGAHCRPGLVLRSEFPVRCCAVNNPALTAKAPARTCAGSSRFCHSQHGGRDNLRATASAKTEPRGAVVDTTNVPDDGELPDSVPGEVYAKFRHDEPPVGSLRGSGAGASGTRFSGATLAPRQYSTGGNA